MSPTKNSIRITAGLAAAIGSIALAAPAATAATATDYQVNGASIRQAPNGSSAAVGMGYIGDGATLICGAYGPSAQYNGSEYWIYSRNHKTGVTGWSAGSSFAGVINRTPAC